MMCPCHHHPYLVFGLSQCSMLDERACADFYAQRPDLFATFRMHFILPSQPFFVDALLILLHCIMSSPAHPTHFFLSSDHPERMQWHASLVVP